MKPTSREDTRAKPLRDQDGFTLVELMIVTVVIMVLTTIVFPGIAGTLEAYRLETSAFQIEGKLVEARLNAIKRNREVWLQFELGAGNYQIQTTDPLNPGVDINLGGTQYLPTMVTFEASTPAEMTFTSLGRPTGPSTVTLRAADTGEQKSIAVSATGRIQIN